LAKKMTNKEKIETIFSNTNKKKHILHLYTPTLNKYAIQSSFLGNKKADAVYVTADEPETTRKQLESFAKEALIIPPKEMEKIGNYKKIVIDAGSIDPETIKIDKKHRRIIGEDLMAKEYVDYIKREKHLCNLKGNQSILCTYDLSKLTPNKIKQLVKFHDQLIITTDETAVISSKTLSPKNLNISNELIDESLKNELDTVVLALIMAKPMCGTDIKKAVYEKFGLLLSSGTLYPLLHKLQKSGLLKYNYGIKTKIYEPVNEKNIQTILDEKMRAKNFLTDFIQANNGGMK